MLANFVMLAQLSVCPKQHEVVPYADNYDVDEENGSQDAGVRYDMEHNTTNTNASATRGVRVHVRHDEYDVHENGSQDPDREYDCQ
jgi:hypothetical protein